VPLLTVSGIVKRFGGDTILQGLDFRLERGEHVALVGANGSGKSTLLRIIAGEEEPDAGRVSLSRNALLTYVPQDPQFHSEHTLHEAVMSVFAAALAAEREMREVERRMAAGDEGRELQERYRHLTAIVEHAGYDLESRVDRVLTGLDLSPDLWNRPVEQLSGGQRTRAGLARALLQESDLLLLDEPTNHLDIQALEWLETFLRSQRQAVLVVAHDRHFLEAVTSRTLDLIQGRIDDYPSSYSGFLRLREERRSRQNREFARQQEEIAKTEEFVRRFGAGQRSKEAKGRQKRLDRLDRLTAAPSEASLRIRVDSRRRKGDRALEIRGLVAGYERPLVQAPDQLAVPHGSRVAVVGPNGSGKTTFVRTIVGDLGPLAGSASWAPNLRIGYYSQTGSDSLGHEGTVLEVFEQRFPVAEASARDYLGRFLFSEDDVFKRVTDLSGGERSRLALALLLREHNDVLVLDEPTNHLDIGAREALESALSVFSGTEILVSHDRYLIDKLATETWAVEDGRLAVHDGTWSDYVAGRYRRGVGYSVGPEQPAASPDALAVVARLRERQTATGATLEQLAAASGSAAAEHLNRLMQEYAGHLEELTHDVGDLTRALR